VYIYVTFNSIRNKTFKSSGNALPGTAGRAKFLNPILMGSMANFFEDC